ncbi:MAG: DUF3800 domain-containing protein [Flavobacteriales bacterium]|nr:DUF3800 domain-containing protein [Flavobacteriales bacterium]
MKTAIYIDDTGTPQKSKSKYDSGDWKSWVAVILDSKERIEIREGIDWIRKYAIEGLEINEFHFTDIFSGKNEFKKISIEKRIKIFELFAQLYKHYNCPILIQSLSDDDIIRNEMTEFNQIKIPGFDFSKNSDLCLWLLLIRLKKSEVFKKYQLPVEIFIDNGIQKPNTSRKSIELQDFALNSEIKYIDSKCDSLMQFIDFIAFCLNRTRWILMNNKKDNSDFKIMEISQLANFNTVNMLKQYVDINDTNTTEYYDRILRNAFDINGNLTDEEVEKIKNK